MIGQKQKGDTVVGMPGRGGCVVCGSAAFYVFRRIEECGQTPGMSVHTRRVLLVAWYIWVYG